MRLADVSVLVVTDDHVLRRGLVGCVADDGIAVASMSVNQARDSDQFDAEIEFALVPIATPTNLDGFAGISAATVIARLRPDIVIVAILSGAVSDVVMLRLAEVGVRFGCSYDVIAHDPHRLITDLAAGGLPPAYLLATPAVLRARLGLDVVGELGGFLAAAAALPEQVWTDTGRGGSVRASVNRRQQGQLRRAAREVAGLPAPSFLRHATSMRTAPQLPEWPTVRTFVRQCWGIAD